MAEENLPIEQCNSEATPEKIERTLIQVNPKIFEGIKKEKKEQIISAISFSFSKIHIGPLPDPETLAEYSKLIPEGADRIMKMAESQSSHRMALEKKAIFGQTNQSLVGQIFALIIGISGIIASTYCALNGHDAFASILGGTTIVSLVYTFIRGKKYQEKNLREKNPIKK